MSQQPKKSIAALSAVGGDMGGIHLREFTSSTLVILQQIDSPLLRLAAGKKNVHFSDLDALRIIFTLSHPPAESFALLSGGKARFDSAVLEFGDKIPVAAFPALGQAVIKLFTKAASTAPSGPSLKKKAVPAAANPGGKSPSAPMGSAGS